METQMTQQEIDERIIQLIQKMKQRDKEMLEMVMSIVDDNEETNKK